MASDFWSSTQCNTWLLPLSQIQSSFLTSSDHLISHLPISHIHALHIHFHHLIHKLSRKLSLRQPVISTASVYFKRFYLHNDFSRTDPFLVLISCVYVAAKTEESPIHVKSVLAEARSCLAEYTPRPIPTDYTKLAEMEFYLLSELGFDLVCHHPYKTLAAVCGREPIDDGYWSDPAEEDEEIADYVRRTRGTRKRGTGNGGWQVDDGVFQMAWFLLNDSYKTHLSLTHPPYLIALAALYVAFAMEDKTGSDSYRLRGKVLVPVPNVAGAGADAVAQGNVDGDGDGEDEEEPQVWFTIQQGAGTTVGQTQKGSAPVTNPTPTSNPSTAAAPRIRLLTRQTAPHFFSTLSISHPILLSIAQTLVAHYPLWDALGTVGSAGAGAGAGGKRFPAPGMGMGLGLAGNGNGNGEGVDPKAALMAYRAAQMLRRSQGGSQGEGQVKVQGPVKGKEQGKEQGKGKEKEKIEPLQPVIQLQTGRKEKEVDIHMTDPDPGSPSSSSSSSSSFFSDNDNDNNDDNDDNDDDDNDEEDENDPNTAKRRPDPTKRLFVQSVLKEDQIGPLLARLWGETAVRREKEGRRK